MESFGDIPWGRLNAWGWSFVACSILLLLTGIWRLYRGDARISESVAPRDRDGPFHPFIAALGVASFGVLFTYLFSCPPWLTQAVQTVYATLGADNHGHFLVEQESLRFGVTLGAQLIAVSILLLQQRTLPGMLHTRPDANDSERLFLNRRDLFRLGGLFATSAALLTLGSLLWAGFASAAEAQGQKLPGEVQPLVELIAHWNGPAWVLGVLFASVTVGAPLLEEIGFRAILYPALREAIPRGWAMALTGLLFGMMHGNLAALIPLSIMGAWLCQVRDRHGIGTCILIHTMSNAWTVFWLITAPEIAGKL